MKNSKNTKRALVLSVLSVVMCMAMLIGTTFAWFTDTASTSVSNVKAGTLNLEIYGEDGQPVGDRVLTWKKAAEGADQQILWEPGCTYDLETITIRNIGELSLKYKIEITGIKGDAKLNEAIEWTIDGADLGAEYPLGVGEEKTVTISGHMKEEAGNEYQGMEITGIQIDVKAVQDTVEYDSNGNTYDENADGTPQFDGWGDKVSGSEEVVAGEDTLIKDREENPTITVQIPADTTDATSLTLMKTKTDTPAGLVESGSTYSTVKVEVLDQDGNSVTLPKGKTFVLTMQVGKGKQLVGFYRGTSKSPLTLAKSADAVKANKNQYYYDAETGIVTFSTDALNTFTVRTLNDTFAGGDGTQESPYLVATAQQALNMR